MRNRVVAAIFAFFLGGFGVHKFYLGEVGAGLVYLLLSWTFIPQFLAIFECIGYLLMSDADFDRRYNGESSQRYQRTVTRRYRQMDGSEVVVRETVSGHGGYASQTTTHTPPPRPQPQSERVPRGRPSVPEYAQRRPQNKEERERFVLLAARDHGGLLTPAELATATQLSLREAKEALDDLQRQGVADCEVNPDNSTICYVFPDLQPAERMRQPRQSGSIEDELDAR